MLLENHLFNAKQNQKLREYFILTRPDLVKIINSLNVNIGCPYEMKFNHE